MLDQIDAPAMETFREVYFAEAEGLGLVKIGSATNSKHRVASLQIGCPVRLVLKGVLVADDAVALERQLHRHHEGQRARGEWFRINDALRYTIDECLFQPEEVADRHVTFSMKPRAPEVRDPDRPVCSPRPGESIRRAVSRFAKEMAAFGEPLEA